MTAPDATPIADADAGVGDTTDAGDDTTPTVAAGTPSRWRRVVAIVLVVLAVVLAPLTVVARWVHDEILDTDGWVETVAPLANDPVVTDALANRIVNELFAATDLQDRVTDALPGPVDALGPALTSSLKGLALNQTERLLESDAFERLWIQANRTAHGQVVAMFSGRSDAVRQDHGKVVLDLGVVADKVRERLVDRGVGVLRRVSVPSGTIEVTLFESESIPELQTTFRVLDDLATVLPILLVVTVVGAIAIAPRRRAIVVALGLGVAAATALLSVGIDLGRRETIEEASAASLSTDATKAVYDALVATLRDWVWYVIVAALLVAVVALVSNPRWIGRVADRLRGDSPDVPPVATWVRAHRAALWAAVVGVALVVLVIWPTPTLLAVVVVVLLAALGIGVVTALGRMTPRASLPPEAAGPAEEVDQLG